jgi:Cu/Ag efflux protein CusF
MAACYGRFLEDHMNRTLLSLALTLALAVAAAPAALAHGGHDHVMGTVKAVDLKARTVEVETKDGKRVSVQIDDKTKYLRGDAAAQESDLATGLRVVIDATTVDGKQLAKEIKLGPAPK